MAFMAEDTIVTIVPNFSLPAATGGFMRCIAVRRMRRRKRGNSVFFSLSLFDFFFFAPVSLSLTSLSLSLFLLPFDFKQQGSFGPFSPNLPVDVPLWLALSLHGMKRCRLLPPEWLSPAALAAVDGAERASGSRFEPLPEGFLEVGRLLLTRCRGEFETREYDEVRTLFYFFV